jgi:uncharacterized protein YjbI with pentapeptide repeats
LEGTDPSDVQMGVADYSDANLKDPKLSGTYLYHTDLSHRAPLAKCCPA